MTQEIEIEFKNLLTEDEFKQLYRAYHFPKEPVLQVNYYFETPDFSLQKHGCALRIRKKNGDYILTLKEPHASGLLETHDTLDDKTAHKWFQSNIIPQPNTAKQLRNMGVEPEELFFRGELRTKRWEINHKNVVLVLDESEYHGKQDHELELEASTPKDGEKIFHEILEKEQIPKRDTPNKIERFFAFL